jgi:hypothetical protein
MDTIGEFPLTEELEQLVERLLTEYAVDRSADGFGDELMIIIGAIYECISLRNGIEHALATCTDPTTVAYLADLREKASQYYTIIGDTEIEK